MTTSPVADAVVVGGGISGLATALALVDAGRTVRVLEARGRVGGRLLRVDVDGVGLDLGATWFWPGERRVAALVARLGLATHPQHLAGDAVYEGDAVRRLVGNPVDVPASRVTAGMGALAGAVAAALPPGVVELGVAVEAVEVDADGVAVHGSGGTWRGAHVVLAVPPALVAADVTVLPPLPEPLDVVAPATPVWMGATTKVVAHYATPFWRASGHNGAGVSHVGPLRELHDMSGPGGTPAALFGFATSTPGQPTTTADEAVEQLVRLHGAAAGDPLALHVQDWRRERWTSPPDVGVLMAQAALGHAAYRRPSHGGRLHWAGTETAGVAAGHVEGALDAAARAARAVLGAQDGAGPSGGRPAPTLPPAEEGADA